jgi:hypothetical protein
MQSGHLMPSINFKSFVEMTKDLCSVPEREYVYCNVKHVCVSADETDYLIHLSDTSVITPLSPYIK